MTRGRQATLQSVRLLTRDGRDWRHAAEELVVVSHLLDALGADASAAENVREERADVVEPLGPAERDDENGVEWTSTVLSIDAETLDVTHHRPTGRSAFRSGGSC